MELFFTMLVPLIIAAVALYGMARRVDVYDALVQGAGEGLGVLLRIVPPLVGLLTAVYMLRASGALELAARRWPRCSPPWASRRRPWHSCWCGRSAARQHWGWGRSSSPPTAPTP